MSRIGQDDATYRTGITYIGSAYLATNGVKVVLAYSNAGVYDNSHNKAKAAT